MSTIAQTPGPQPSPHLHVSGDPYSNYTQVIFLDKNKKSLDLREKPTSIPTQTLQESIAVSSQHKEPYTQGLCKRCCFSIVGTLKDCGDRIRTVFTNCCCDSNPDSKSGQ